MTTTDPSTRTAEDRERALDVIVDIATERCEQSGHECDWECSLLERSVKSVRAELDRARLLRSAKDHAVEQSDKHARRLIEWREAAEKATRERDAYAKAKAENDERFQLAAAEAREERDAALARVAELEGQLARARENQIGFARARARIVDLEEQIAEAREALDVDGWELAATPRGVMVSNEAGTDSRVLVYDVDEALPVGAVLAFIADTEEASDEG